MDDTGIDLTDPPGEPESTASEWARNTEPTPPPHVAPDPDGLHAPATQRADVTPAAGLPDPLVRPAVLEPAAMAPPAGVAAVPGLAAADGRRRRRTALAVVLAAVVAGGAGMYVGSRIESPADRAAARSAPVPSLITVPVERRQLTSEIVLNGEVAYNEPLTVRLAGPVGLGAGDTAVVTEIREPGTPINEGDMVVEVTGRPVFALQGDLPMYRRLAVGSEGPDVLQLEQALSRLGYPVEPVDTVFDATTAAAVEQMYTDRGYAAEGPSAEQQADLAAARDGVVSAERGVADARAALAQAADPLPESQRLQLQQAVTDAREAIPTAEAAAQAARTEQDQQVATAQAARDTARTQRDAAATIRDRARTPGAIDPDTGEAYTPERAAALDVAAAEAQQAYTAAEGQLVIAEQQRVTQVAAADRAIDDARAQLQIAEAQLREALAGTDTSALQEAVTAAEAALAAAQVDLVTLQAAAGTRISPGEIVFVPLLPSTLTESYVTPGSGLEGPIGMLATTDTLVRARVARADAPLVAVGASVDVEIRDAGVTTSGTVLSVGEPESTGTEQPGGPSGPGGGGSSGRLEVVVAPGAGTDLGMYMWYGVRVRVQIDATDGEVLVVPVAALTVGPDEVSQVEVERVPATDAEPAETEVVTVTVGLTADGLAEVAPIDAGALDEGDRVVIGVDTNTLPGAEAPPVSAAPDDATGGDDGGDDGGDGGDDSGDSGDDPGASPLAELMGWVSDPVEERRQQLAIEEAVAECMREAGWEYTPVDWSAQMPDTDVDMSDPKAYGEKYGYGVIYNYETYELGGGDGPGVVIEDPNMEYVNSLTPDEQQAYQADLYGDPGIWEGPVTSDVMVSPPLEDQGCQGIARLEVVGEDPSSDPEVARALEDFYSGQQNDPALDAAVADWAACFKVALTEYGIDTEPKQIYDGYQIVDTQKYLALGAEVVPVANQAEMDEYFNSGENVLTAFGDETGAGYVVLAPGEPGDPLPELTGEQIDELTEMELALWRADQECLAESGHEQILREQEQALVDDLLSQFPELGR